VSDKKPKFCDRCKKEVVGMAVCFPDLIEKGMHPKCAVQTMKENPDKLKGRIPQDLLDESPEILQAMLEQISEDPTRGRAVSIEEASSGLAESWLESGGYERTSDIVQEKDAMVCSARKDGVGYVFRFRDDGTVDRFKEGTRH
jgi:hypothetical protein